MIKVIMVKSLTPNASKIKIYEDKLHFTFLKNTFNSELIILLQNK